jgi:hypothetical protein
VLHSRLVKAALVQQLHACPIHTVQSTAQRTLHVASTIQCSLDMHLLDALDMHLLDACKGPLHKAGFRVHRC